uniref:Uncharacterized protein n=1 Tax=Arundo donax TaxID=35708 RepID=A0A0A9H3S7_ARUDO
MFSTFPNCETSRIISFRFHLRGTNCSRF